MESQKARGRQAMKEKRLAGRAALSFGAEQTAYLQKAGVKPTGTVHHASTDHSHRGLTSNPLDDSDKYKWDVSPAVEIKAIFTPTGFVGSIEEGTDSFGIVLDKTSFYAESGGEHAR